eukprot:COSAG01_NODE_2742_length_7152_cov_9.268538_6_plen_73_part_00
MRDASEFCSEQLAIDKTQNPELCAALLASWPASRISRANPVEHPCCWSSYINKEREACVPRRSPNIRSLCFF